MKPSQKGWLTEYYNSLNRGNTLFRYFLEMRDTYANLNEEQKLYGVLQPTGLLYGYPLAGRSPFQINMKKWDEKSRMKMVLADSIMNHALLISPGQSNHKHLADYLQHSLEELIMFYRTVQPEYFKKKRFNYKTPAEGLEKLFDDRIKVQGRLNKSYWTSLFQNSLLFLDVYYYGLWMKKETGIINFNDFENHQNQMRLLILQLIASAAQANQEVTREEQNIFHFFLQSAGLPYDLHKKASLFIKDRIGLEDIDLSVADSWILKKYLLELALLTLWTDKEVDELEKTFLKKLSSQLSMPDEEGETSMMAIESFVISHWDEVSYLQSTHNFSIVRDHFSKKLKHVVVKNTKAVEQELRESKELMQLLLKANKGKLNPEEQKKVKAQLIDILKTIPTFVIIALPGTFITLPLLIKLLPKSAFPSAFSEEEEL